nr:hypothetical protein [Actinomycetota bacterium]
GAAAVLGLKVRGKAGRLVGMRAGGAAATLIVGTAVASTTHEIQAVAAALIVSTFLTAATGWVLLLRDGDSQPSAEPVLRHGLLPGRRA